MLRPGSEVVQGRTTDSTTRGLTHFGMSRASGRKGQRCCRFATRTRPSPGPAPLGRANCTRRAYNVSYSEDWRGPARDLESCVGSVSSVGELAAVTSRYLLAVFDSVYVVALAAWVGSSMFFVFGVAPVMLKLLGMDTGRQLVRAVYPRYYLWGTIAGAVALPAYVAGPLCYHEYRGTMVAVQGRWRSSPAS